MMSFFSFQTAGKCPTAPVKPECPPPVSLCSIDDECTGTQKCCDDGCSGSECREAGNVFVKIFKWLTYNSNMGLSNNYLVIKFWSLFSHPSPNCHILLSAYLPPPPNLNYVTVIYTPFLYKQQIRDGS